MAWQKALSENDIDPTYPTPVDIGEKSIAIYRLNDQVYATSNICTHEHAYLSDGYVENDCIECPLHQAVFHIPTGELRAGPSCDNLKTFPVKIENGEVFVDC